MMNYFIKSQIINMIAMSKTFEQSCKIAAITDDGVTSKAEAKVIQKISAATNKYIAELEKLKDQGGHLDLDALAALFKRRVA